MDFLGKVVKESARKRPVMVISTPEYVTCPMVIGNFHSPPGVSNVQPGISSLVQWLLGISTSSLKALCTFSKIIMWYNLKISRKFKEHDEIRKMVKFEASGTDFEFKTDIYFCFLEHFHSVFFQVEVSVDNSAVNSDTGVWGDTETFNPRRFDEETSSMRKSLCRFGIGPRRCMGYRVADTFMKVLLVTLLGNYSVALETQVTGDDDSVPVQNVGPFCYPCVEFKVQVVQ